MGKWQDQAKELEQSLRLRTFPLAIKFVAKKADVDQVPRVRKLDHVYTFCQLVGLARTAGWALAGMTDRMRPGCAHIAGLQKAANRHQMAGVWFDGAEETDKQYEVLPHIPFDGHEAVLVAPLASEKFEPDIVLVHGIPGQLYLLLSAFVYKDYERLKFYFSGESSCSDGFAEAYKTGKPALSVPCYGQRRFGHVMDDELELAMPPDWVGKGLEGMRWLNSKGFRYPMTTWGLDSDPAPGLSVSYGPQKK